MKKIIELAENICRAATPMTRIALDIDRLEKELVKRKTLESTPITKEWLEEHGWKKNEMVFHSWSKTSEVGIREFATLAVVNCYNKGWYVNDTPIRVNTLADLYDVCELCGISMED